jgi:hypothetical protein
MKFKIENKFNTIIVLGLGGLGSSIIEGLMGYLKLLDLEYENNKEEMPLKNIFFYDADTVYDKKELYKLSFNHNIVIDTEIGSRLITSYHKYELLKKQLKWSVVDYIADQYDLNVVILEDYFTEKDALYMLEHRKELGRILLIDATDRKAVVSQFYMQFIMKDDMVIAIGYDYSDEANGRANGMHYTIYINPSVDSYSTFQNEYNHVPMSNLLANWISSYMWFLISHVNLDDYYDINITGDLLKEAVRTIDMFGLPKPIKKENERSGV